MNARRAVLGLLVGASVLCGAKSARAFCQKTTCTTESCARDERSCLTEGKPLWWGKTVLSYRFQRDGTAQLLSSEARAAVRDAFHVWTDVMCDGDKRTSLRIEEGEDVTPMKALADVASGDPFGIYFQDKEWDANKPLELARTLQSFTAAGRVTYADINVNTSGYKFSVEDDGQTTDLQAVLTHEVGHFIGLDHSLEADTIMASSHCSTETRCKSDRRTARRLAPDDIDAVCTLYPPGPPRADLAQDGTPKCNSAGQSAPTQTVWALMLSAVVACASRMRSRSRARSR